MTIELTRSNWLLKEKAPYRCCRLINPGSAERKDGSLQGLRVSASVLKCVCPSDDWEKRCSCIASLKPSPRSPRIPLGGPGETGLTPALELRLRSYVPMRKRDSRERGDGTPLRPQSWLVVERSELGVKKSQSFPPRVWCGVRVPASVLRIQSLMKEMISTDRNYNPVCRGLEEPAELSSDRSALPWGPRGGLPGRCSLN